MIPRLGDTVVVVGVHSGGSSEQPGVVTRVLGSWDTKTKAVPVGVTIFPYNNLPLFRSSIEMFATLEQASAAGARLPFCYLQLSREK